MKTIQDLCKSDKVYLTSRGNEAIKTSLKLMFSLGKRVVFIPDQGGWLTFRQYPLELGMLVVELKTDDGVINPDNIPDSSVAVLLYQDYAGYFASQPLEDIKTRCLKLNIPIILDVTATIGTDRCNQKYADILIASFGKSKPVNAGYGGFIASNNYEFENTFDESKTRLIEQKLSSLNKRLIFLQNFRKKVLDDLKLFNILHRDKDGINVVIAYDDEDERNNIVKYCKQNSLEYTVCPRYIRVLKKAISIEIKRKVF